MRPGGPRARRRRRRPGPRRPRRPAGGPAGGRGGGATTAAVMRFQRRHGLTPDGVAGPKTRRAFGRFAKHVLGSRLLPRGMAGWDVAELQFALAWHGFPNAAIDGGFGGHVKRALIK